MILNTGRYRAFGVKTKINFTLFDGRVGALRVHRPLGLSYYWVTILQLHEYTKMKFKNLMAAATIHSLSIRVSSVASCKCNFGQTNRGMAGMGFAKGDIMGR